MPERLPLEAGGQVDHDGWTFETIHPDIPVERRGVGVHARPSNSVYEAATRREVLADALVPIARRLVPDEAAYGAPVVAGAALGIVTDRDGGVLAGEDVSRFDGFTMAFRHPDGDVRFAPVVSLSSRDPLGALYHETAHVNLREGRFHDEELELLARSPWLQAVAQALPGDVVQGGTRRSEEALAYTA